MSTPEAEPEAFKIGPNLLGTPERMRARLRAVHQAIDCARMRSEARPTDADFEAYRAQFPTEAERLGRVHSVSSYSSFGGTAGLIGGAAAVYRITKSPPLILSTSILCSLAGHLVTDDVSSLLLGTYKLDVGGENAKYLKWVCERRQQSA